jgi:hypothetical protein
MATTVTLATVRVNEAGMLGLRAKVAMLHKRAERHGMVAPTVAIVKEVPFVPVIGKRFGCSEYLYDVEVNGCEPRIDGYRLAARIDFTSSIGPVVKIVPGTDDDGSYSQYRDHDGSCEHCNSLRRRNDVFVLEHLDGRRKVVGRNCLADFLRCGDAATLAEYAEWVDRLSQLDSSGCSEYAEESLGYGSRLRPVKGIVPFLTVTAMITRRIGWMGRTKARDLGDVTATADNVSYYFYGKGKHHALWVAENDLSVTDKDAELADKAIKWACEVDASRNEYLDTIQRIAQSGSVDMGKLDGYAASIIIAYKKACEYDAERAKKAAAAPDKVFIGDAGKKGQQDIGRVRVVRMRTIEGYYGLKTIVAMEADLPDGSVAPIVWFASGEHDYDEGCEYDLRAGIKEHSDDAKWGKQTIVTRAKLTSREAVVA